MEDYSRADLHAAPYGEAHSAASGCVFREAGAYRESLMEQAPGKKSFSEGLYSVGRAYTGTVLYEECGGGRIAGNERVKPQTSYFVSRLSASLDMCSVVKSYLRELI